MKSAMIGQFHTFPLKGSVCLETSRSSDFEFNRKVCYAVTIRGKDVTLTRVIAFSQYG